MTPLVLAFPAIEPEIFRIGPFALRWYAVAYIAGIVIGWRVALRMVERPPRVMSRAALDDFIAWVTLGVILGGRLGYVLFYKPLYYLGHPLEVFALWNGGMSFHGGALGVILATVAFAWRRGVRFLALADIVAMMTPIGLFFGRLANFVNAELYGRESDVAWAMIFPSDPRGVPRHPSQLYEAALEGLVLFVALVLVERLTAARLRPGLIGGLFLVGYGIARIVCEFFREPDAHLGFLYAGATMGQLLSLPMLAAGIALVARALRAPATSQEANS
ncbi:MAG: prolipoprotein diacylglyceryl transferase [Alphaproteobacteria bacterium]|nr:prolipoprotein diacylglyceryl transferase [Alphaproteobacteria bacterium]